MDIFLPIAGMSINIFLLITIGGAAGFLSGLFGVGGGFLLTPLMIMIGIPPAVAAASDSNQIVAAASSGAASHYRIGNVDVKMGLLLFAGGFFGGILGVISVKLFRAQGNFDFFLRLVYILMLGSIGGLMLKDSICEVRSRRVKKPRKSGREVSRAVATGNILNKLPLQTNFPKLGLRTTALFPLALGFIAGLLAAFMGVGGGFFMMPMLIYILGMPTFMAVGTSLFQTVLTAATVTIQQSWINQTVDIILAVTLFCGSVVGAQFGVQAGKKLKTEQLRMFFALIILAVMVKMAIDIVTPPENIIKIIHGGGH